MGPYGKVTLVVLVCAMAASASSCGDVVVRSRIVCLRCGASAEYEERTDRASETSREWSVAAALLKGRPEAEPGERVRDLVLRYVISVTEGANSGRGRVLRASSQTGGCDHFWSPAHGYTRCAVCGAMSVVGLSFALTSPTHSVPGHSHVWLPADYTIFRARAGESMRGRD